jgi:hypothetical protein
MADNTSTAVYVIEHRGRKHRYATLRAAMGVAEKIFQATGIVIAISAEPAKQA